MRTGLLVLLLLAVLSSSALADGDNWWENLKFHGDFRYRHEVLDSDAMVARQRHRLRLRFGVAAQVNSEVYFNARLSTGSANPVSNNTTLDNAASKKAVVWDLLYLRWQPKAAPGLDIVVGKTKNPFYLPGKSEVIWDSDLTPEGGFARWERDFGRSYVNVLGVGQWVEERSTGLDSWMAGVQGIGALEPADQTRIAGGVGYIGFVNSAGFPVFFDGDPRGNTTTTQGGSTVYVFEYKLVDAFIELNQKLGEVPTTLFAEVVQNTDPESGNTGWITGLRVGKVKKLWSWAVRYNYRRVEQDAILGIFSDSDFRNGGTNAKGHEVGGDLGLGTRAQLSVTYFDNSIGLDGTDDPFKRLQVDFKFAFGG